MARIRCDIRLFSRSRYISQIVTGYIMLHRQRVIDLNILYLPDEQKNYPVVIEVLVNRIVKITYDICDGYNFDRDKIEQYLSTVDFYFKRSYDPALHSDFRYKERIFPMGFYYNLTTKRNIIDSLRYATPRLAASGVVKKALGLYYFEKFEDIPQNKKNIKVLFNVRLWDPDDDDVRHSKELIGEREEINQMRIDCIDKLKCALGNRFVGGIMATDYAKRVRPDLLLNGLTVHRLYFMKLIKDADICIATTGLHRSNGGKLAEYIAASKSIVSERLHYQVPGDFSKDKNYLEFDTADKCVENTTRLIEDRKLALEMKIENYLYYHNYLRPDRLVFNTLAVAMEHAEQF